MRKRTARIKKSVLLAFLVIATMSLGGFFRFYHLNWDQGHTFHPDERNIANAVVKIQFFSHMDPEFFAYGSVPIYLYRATGDILNLLTHTHQWTYDWGQINLIGRFYSALFSTLTIGIVFLLGLSLGLPLIGFIAAWFTAFTPILVQQAHFGVTESMITFWAIMLTYCSIPLIKKITVKHTVQIGILLGLAVSTKMSCLSFTAIPFAALVMHIFFSKTKKNICVWDSIYAAFGLVATACLLFTLLSPYTFFSSQKFFESMDYEGGIVWGRRVVVYVYQFLGTLPYLFQIKQLWFTQGPVLMILSLFGSVYVFFKEKTWKNPILLAIFFFPLVYFLLVGMWFAKFVRYIVPIYPFLSLSAALLVGELLQMKLWKNVNRIYKRTALFIILFAQFLYSVAFLSIYSQPQTRITASEWIYKHIPQGATILTEHWDDGLPIPIPPNHPDFYNTDQLTIYEPDNEQKLVYYADKLSNADYIIINSRRLYGTLLRLTDRYPLTGRYYQKLFDGSLGYEKVAEFSSYPSLTFGTWNIVFPDENTEETVQVYDHPKPMIFKNVRYLNIQTLMVLLNSAKPLMP